MVGAEMDGREHGLMERDLTEQVIGAFYAVYNELGPGFLESVYVNSLLIALGAIGLKAIACGQRRST